MELRQLRYFVAIAQERNFTRASLRLHIAQPPLSRQIRQLEAEFGAELIDRSSRPLQLTDAGRLLYEQALQVLARIDEMQSMMRRATAIERRRFVIGFVASTIYARLPPLIREFRAAAPHVELNLIELTSLEQIAALKEGRIDVGFGRIRFDDEAVRRTILREESLIAALPAGHKLATSGVPVSLKQISEEPLIVYPRFPRPSYADQVLALFFDQGLEPRIAQEARELQIALGLVAAEEGICIVPESVQKSRMDDIAYVAITEPVVSPIIMSHRANDNGPEIALMAQIISRMYATWGYEKPQGLERFAAAC